ncbi:hypothetical protein OROHE_015342 [Orobanche hederae]
MMVPLWRPSQDILKIRDGTPLEAEEILIYIKNPRNGSVWNFYSKLYVPSNVVQKKRVARILFFKIRPSQEILKIHDGTPLEAEEILTYIKGPRNRPSKYIEILKIRDGTPLEKRVARILFFKIRPSQEILKIHDGTPLEAEKILTYIKGPRNRPSKYIVARILFFKISPSQEILKIHDDILKIRDGTPLEAEEILIYIKNPRNGSVWNFYSKLYVPSNVVQKKRVARILFFKIRPSQEILKIHDVQKKRLAQILFFKIRLSQEILKIRDGTPLEAEEILTYIKKKPRNGLVWHFSSKLDVPSNIVQKKRVARILFFKIRPSQEILKIHDGTPLEAKEILTYINNPRNGSVWHFYSKLYVPSNVVQKKRVARILFFKIRPSQEILKIHDGTPLEWPSQDILKIRDGTPLEAEEILIYIKNPRKGSVWNFYSKLYVPSNVVQKKRVARILFFKIRPSQEILKIHDGTPLEAEEILTYIKGPRNRPSKYIEILKIRDGTPLELDVPSNIVQKKRVARILFFKIRPSQEILKIHDGTPLEAKEILTYINNPRNGSVWHFYSKLYVPSNVVQKKRVARILFFKIRPSQEILKIHDGTPLEMAWILFFKIRPSQDILKIRDGTPLEAEEILIYIKNPRKGSVWNFYSKLYVPSNVVQKKRVARILFFKIRPSQEILKIHDGTPLEAEEILTYIKGPRNRPSKYIVQKKRVARILFFKIRPSQEILKIHDGTPLEAKEILTYINNPRNGSVWHFYSKLYVPSNVVQKKRVARILFFKIRPSQEILKIHDGTPLEKRVARILPSQDILKIRDGTPLEAEEILIYIKNPRNGSVWNFYSKLYVPSNVVQKKRVARILFFKIRPSQEILKIHDGTPLEAEEILTYIKGPRNRPSKYIGGRNFDIHKKKPRNGLVWHFSSKLDVPSNIVQKKRVARILFFKIRPSQEILKIHDGTPLEAKEILTYINNPRNGSVWHFYSKLYVPSNVVQKKRVARILFFKIRPSQEILKIHDGTPLEAEEILTYIKKPSKRIEPSQDILKIRDGTPLEAEEILIYIKNPRKGSVWNFYSKLYVPSNVVQKKRVARILFFKIRPSQEILKIHDGTPLEAEEILTYIKGPRNRPSKYIEILKIRDGTPLELDVPSNIVQKKRVARILFFKIRPSQEILKIHDGTPLEAKEILTYINNPRNGSVWHFYSKLYVPSNVVQKKRVERILFFKIRPSQETLKIRDGTPLEAEEILTYIKKPSKRIGHLKKF